MIPIISILIFVILLLIGIFAFFAAKEKQKEIKRTGKYPEGHFVGMWMGIGMAIFAGSGIAISSSTGNPGLLGVGPAIGVAFGAAIGTSVEKKYKKQGKIRPLTEKERKNKRIALVAGFVMLLLGIAAFLFMLLK